MRSGRKGYKMMTLDGLKTGQSGKILQVNGQGALRHHLLDMGLTPGTVVTLRKVAPMGDPVQIELRGYELTLRLDEAQKMEIEEIQKERRKTGREKAWTWETECLSSHCTSGSWGTWKGEGLPEKQDRGDDSKRPAYYLCPGRKSELWEDNAV